MSMTDTADRALELFSRARPEWSAHEAAVALGVSIPEAAGALAMLTTLGLLDCPGDDRYRLGWRNLALAARLLRTSPFRGTGTRVARELAERSGETILVAVWERRNVLCVARHDGASPLPEPFPEVGERLADTRTAAGKVLLAGRPATVREQLPRAVQLELEAIRTAGYACAPEPLLADVTSIAAPVTDGPGGVVAALSMAVPSSRWRGAQLRHRQDVARAAADISRSLRQLAVA